MYQVSDKFREYCKFTQELYELLVEEEKMESMSEEESDKLQENLEKMVETLKSSDLSDIPFEEWENFVLVIQDFDLENTGANIDFNLLTIPSEMNGYTIEINLKGCNVRNFNFDKKMFRYTSESFDPEFVEAGDDGYLVVDYAKLSVIPLKAVDILYDEVSKLKNELKTVKEENKLLKHTGGAGQPPQKGQK